MAAKSKGKGGSKAAAKEGQPEALMPETAKGALRSRIEGEAEVDPATLRAHPSNWRVHSAEQRDAIREVLSSVGWVQRVVVNRTTGNILDGHMRVEEAFRMGEPRVPVLYVNLTEAEERKMLAVFDPVGGMATVDKRRLRAALEGINTEGDGLGALVDDLRKKAGLGSDDDEDERPEVMFTEELLEEHNYVVLYFENPVDWLYLQSLHPLPKVKSLRSEGKFSQVGQARVFKGVPFLKAVRGEEQS
jgi:hypothetical protein